MINKQMPVNELRSPFPLIAIRYFLRSNYFEISNEKDKLVYHLSSHRVVMEPFDFMRFSFVIFQ